MSRSDWDPQFARAHPAFSQLRDQHSWLADSDWPACVRLDRRLPLGLKSAQGMPLRFLPQDETLLFPELYYEERIHQQGIIATRPNWHDFFNALIWGLFPHSKVAINTCHAADLLSAGKARTPQRDALTVLDENGVVIAASRRSLLNCLIEFDWQRLFVTERAAWGQEVGCFVFGHAVLEKFLQPYVGMTAHALLVEVDDRFFSYELAAQQAELDQTIRHFLLAGGLDKTRRLNPFPLLGVPGWWPVQDADFYAQQQYFRAKSRERDVSILQHRCCAAG